MATEVVLPMLGIAVEKGSVLRWLKKEGDPVERENLSLRLKMRR
jgi:pyruvate/2-oxoglutarate dehydrogenase complex dihydrolipoamide acyltransferase (E2) component